MSCSVPHQIPHQKPLQTYLHGELAGGKGRVEISGIAAPAFYFSKAGRQFVKGDGPRFLATLRRRGRQEPLLLNHKGPCREVIPELTGDVGAIRSIHLRALVLWRRAPFKFMVGPSNTTVRLTARAEASVGSGKPFRVERRGYGRELHHIGVRRSYRQIADPGEGGCVVVAAASSCGTAWQIGLQIDFVTRSQRQSGAISGAPPPTFTSPPFACSVCRGVSIRSFTHDLSVSSLCHPRGLERMMRREEWNGGEEGGGGDVGLDWTEKEATISIISNFLGRSLSRWTANY
ncbi:hypothetical protein R1flu_019148 [Riccia fluitans]|uniref:Uncharacterized protein n=1 Tax=Riccia fluitans TaxID=41844 RepID=A0ABD1ZJC3_9MARC